MALKVDPSMIAMQLNGDIGGQTFYTDKRNRTVMFDKDRVDKPATWKQLRQRAIFTAAQNLWRNLSDEDKQTLEEVTRILSLPLTGQNLYMSALMRETPESYHAVGVQARKTMPPLPKLKNKACEEVHLAIHQKKLKKGDTGDAGIDPDFRGFPEININVTLSQNLVPVGRQQWIGIPPGEAPVTVQYKALDEMQIAAVAAQTLFPDQSSFLCIRPVLLKH